MTHVSFSLRGSVSSQDLMNCSCFVSQKYLLENGRQLSCWNCASSEWRCCRQCWIVEIGRRKIVVVLLLSVSRYPYEVNIIRSADEPSFNKVTTWAACRYDAFRLIDIFLLLYSYCCWQFSRVKVKKKNGSRTCAWISPKVIFLISQRIHKPIRLSFTKCQMIFKIVWFRLYFVLPSGDFPPNEIANKRD